MPLINPFKLEPAMNGVRIRTNKEGAEVFTIAGDHPLPKYVLQPILDLLNKAANRENPLVKNSPEPGLPVAKNNLPNPENAPTSRPMK